MANEFKDTPFQPPKEYRSMDLLYPSVDAYRKAEGLAVAFGGGTFIVGMVVLTILAFQIRMGHQRYLDPTMAFIGFALAWTALRKLVLKNGLPVRLFFDGEGNRLALYTKTMFGAKREYIPAADISHVGLRAHAKAGGEPDVWELAIHLKGDAVKSVPLVNRRLLARQGAERIARAFKVEIAHIDVSGAETRRHPAGVVEEPLMKRLNDPAAPDQNDKEAYVKKTRSAAGVQYDISLPLWLSMGLYTFALANIGAGIFIWKVLPEDQGRWVSVLFAVNTFIIFVVVASLHQMKRPITLGTGGFSYRGQQTALSRIEDITIRKGWILSHLQVVTNTETFDLVVGHTQAVWLKADFERELWNHRNMTPRKDAAE